MSGTTDRIPCPHCGASNFPTSATCWQCGRALRAEAQPPQGVPPPPPGQVPPPYPPPPSGDSATIFIVLGFVFALLFCCPIFQIAGIVMGVLALQRGNKLGTWIIILSVVVLVLVVIAFVWWVSVGAPAYLQKHPEFMPPGQRLPFPTPPQR